MRIKFIVMMLSLLSILQISLLSLFTFIRNEVDLGPRVNIEHTYTLSLTDHDSHYWSDGHNPGLWLAREIGSVNVCPSLIILSRYCGSGVCAMPGAFLSIPSVSILGWSPPHHSRYNYIQTDYVEQREPWFLITLAPLPGLMFSGYQCEQRPMGGPW